MLIFAILACAAGTDTGTEPVSDTATDTAAVTTSTAPALQAHVLEGACLQGITQSVDLGTEAPLQYAVEVRYSSGVAEQMQPDLYLRPSPLTASTALADYESPLYRDGSTLRFSCGYAWEVQGPRIEGEAAGMAVAYRVSWLTLE